MQPHSNRVPYFPENLQDYAPWVARYGLTAPYGECQCGCGQPASIANNSETARGYKAGHPRRYIISHCNRVLPLVGQAPWVLQYGLLEPYGFCQCGCGKKTPISSATHIETGRKKGEPTRFINGHHCSTQSIEVAFWRKVIPASPEQCWEWQGGRNRAGYGSLNFQKQHLTAHRVSFQIHHGEIPDGLWVLHRCDNPPCVNPHHLFLGTRQDNTDDMKNKNRQPRGENKPNARLTESSVRLIRQVAASGVKLSDIAAQYKVSTTTIDCVVKRKTWRHVQ